MVAIVTVVVIVMIIDSPPPPTPGRQTALAYAAYDDSDVMSL